MDGIAYARELGLPLRVAMTETPDNRGRSRSSAAMLAAMGVGGLRGAPAGAARLRGPRGMEVSDEVMVPELTVTADGVHWHPVGGDIDSCPDFLVARGEVPLAEAKRLVVERFLVLRLEDGTLPAAFRCAV